MNSEFVITSTVLLRTLISIMDKIEICSICLDPSPGHLCQQSGIQYLSQDQTALHCGHTFHTQCILPWISQSKCCPLCRTPSSEEDIQISNKSTCVFCHGIKPNLVSFEHIADCTHHRCSDCDETYWTRPCCPVCFPMYTPEGLLNNPTIALVAHIITNIHDIRAMVLLQPP